MKSEIEIDDDDEVFKSVAGKMVNFEFGLSSQSLNEI